MNTDAISSSKSLASISMKITEKKERASELLHRGRYNELRKVLDELEALTAEHSKLFDLQYGIEGDELGGVVTQVPVKYLGSKKKLLPLILETVSPLVKDLGRQPIVADLFSGTARVGYAFKQQGYHVLANDLTTFGYINAQCYLLATPDHLPEIRAHLATMRDLKPAEGFITENYCREARFFTVENGAKIDACRAYLKQIQPSIDPVIHAVLTVALIEAADRVDSTTGVQMAYLKKYAKRAMNPLDLRDPTHLLPGGAVVTQADACSMTVIADVVYLDPPYNQHSYFGNYHIWETIAKGDDPLTYGVARKREDVKSSRSGFTSKRTCLASMEAVIRNCYAPWIVVSFNDEGYISYSDMTTLLGKYGDVVVSEIEYDRYVGAKIGIHNLEGEKVGKVTHTRNKEYVYTLRKRP